ncbi:hypothetical protein Bca4012_089041 [Brassica carinata]
MFIKRYMLQVLIQQRQKWKKCYKTWRFKYKARLKQVHTLLLHGGWCSWSSSCFLWHRWRTHVLWSGWPVQSGNKVMQQRRRSKMPNSWMFKYKEKLHLLSLASG